MNSLGDFDASTMIYGKFTTYRPSTGAPYTLAGSPVLSVYKDNSTTQSVGGVTLTVDFDSLTGLNHFTINTGVDTSFYSPGSFFDIIITTGTVDSVSAVGTVVGRFTLRKNSALKPVVAGRALVVDEAGLADSQVVKIGPSGSGIAGGIVGFERATRCIVTGPVGSSSTTTSVILASVNVNAGAVDCWKGRILIFDRDTLTAALRGQATDITANTSGATPTLTVTALTTAPAPGDTFIVQ